MYSVCMATRINVMIPDALLKRAHNLIEEGFFSNFSEMVREGIRKEIKEYERTMQMSEEERRLFAFLRKAQKNGKLLTEEQMKQYGLDV